MWLSVRNVGIVDEDILMKLCCYGTYTIVQVPRENPSHSIRFIVTLNRWALFIFNDNYE